MKFECPECGRKLNPEDVCPECGVSPRPTWPAPPRAGWPWRTTITYTTGATEVSRVRHYDSESGFDPLRHARELSEDPDVARVDVAISFVAGEHVTPGGTV